jgi:hypothetical protein
LVVRIEVKIGRGCFGESTWIDTFYRDMQVVKRALKAAGYELVYSRSIKRPGYHLRNQPSISSELSAALDGSVAEVDRSQIAIIKQLSFGQRFQLGRSISDLALRIVTNRIQLRNPQFTRAEAHRMPIQNGTSS